MTHIQRATASGTAAAPCKHGIAAKQYEEGRPAEIASRRPAVSCADRPSAARKTHPGSRRSPERSEGSYGALPFLRGRRDSGRRIRRIPGVRPATIHAGIDIHLSMFVERLEHLLPEEHLGFILIDLFLVIAQSPAGRGARPYIRNHSAARLARFRISILRAFSSRVRCSNAAI